MCHLRLLKIKGLHIWCKQYWTLYKIPGRNTFRRRVDDIYDVISCEFKESLFKVQHVAVTTDA